MGGISHGAGLSLLAAGHDARAKAVAAMSAWTDRSPQTYLNAINRSDDAVWQSSAHSATDHLRGTAGRNLTVTPSASSGTLYAYLYDVNLLDGGTLISYLPCTSLTLPRGGQSANPGARIAG